MKRILFLLTVISVAARPIANGYHVGDVVSDFKLKNVDGKMVSLSDFKNAKGFIIIFDCNSCPYSKAYNSRIIALNKKYAPINVPVIAINANDPTQSPDDSFDKMVAEAKTKNYDFPYLADETQRVAKAFGATNTPHVFVLQKQNAALEVIYKVIYIGTIDNNARNESNVSKHYVEDAVNALLEGKEVPVTKTKTIGCGIRWKDS